MLTLFKVICSSLLILPFISLSQTTAIKPGILYKTLSGYTIVSNAGSNGSISPLGTTVVSPGANQVYTITPSNGYITSSLVVDGGSVTPVTTYTFTSVSSNHTISASFTSILRYNVWADYDASNSSTITIGTGVSQWNDAYGSGHNLLQANTSQQPVYSSVTNSVTFNGTNQYIETGSTTLSQPVTIFLVGQQLSWTIGTGIYDGHAADALILYSYPSSPSVTMYAGSFGGAASWTLNTLQVITAVWNNTSSTIGVNDASYSSGTVGTSNPNGFTLGSAAGGVSGNLSHILVYEVIIYNYAMNSTQRTYVYDSLITKW